MLPRLRNFALTGYQNARICTYDVVIQELASGCTGWASPCFSIIGCICWVSFVFCSFRSSILQPQESTFTCEHLPCDRIETSSPKHFARRLSSCRATHVASSTRGSHIGSTQSFSNDGQLETPIPEHTNVKRLEIISIFGISQVVKYWRSSLKHKHINLANVQMPLSACPPLAGGNGAQGQWWSLVSPLAGGNGVVNDIKACGQLQPTPSTKRISPITQEKLPIEKHYFWTKKRRVFGERDAQR